LCFKKLCALGASSDVVVIDLPSSFGDHEYDDDDDDDKMMMIRWWWWCVIMSMVTAMMMMVGDHEYEYDDDTSDARGELLTNSNTEVLTLKFAIKATLDQNTVAR